MNPEIEKLKTKKIIIIGFGREGRSTYNFLRKFFPDKPIAIADKKEINLDDPHITKHTGEDYLSPLEDYDIAFKSPGIPESIPQITKAKNNGVEITSQTCLFFALCKGTIIGVTGTKGKSTTTALIHHILIHSNLPSILIGNIGKPCLDSLDEKNFGEGKYFCFELSSYQLSHLDRSPHIAVFLNIFKEHLDYHGNLNAYFQAKSNITKHQTEKDFFLYNSDFNLLNQLARETKATTRSFSLSEKQKLYETISPQDIPLAGDHNLNNFMASILVAQTLKIPTPQIASAIKTFKPLDHRLQFVAEKNNIRFINDSLATIPEATIAAMKSFNNQIGSLILGGSDRGQDFKSLAQEILNQKTSSLVLFPDTGEKIWKAIEELKPEKLPERIFTRDMQEAVNFCYKHTPQGKVCLLSTASPSFSIFKDYADRANQFKRAIDELK